MPVGTFDLTVTDNGLPFLTEAMVGVGGTPITRVEIGSGLYAPADDQVALVSPYVPSRSFSPPRFAGSQGNIVNIAFMDDEPSADYDVNEVGLFNGNVLIAIASRTQADGGTLFRALRGQRALFAFSFILSRGDPGAVMYVSTFNLFPMTTERYGTGRISSGNESFDRTENDRVMTPQETWRAMLSWRANASEALDRAENDAAATPQRVWQAIRSYRASMTQSVDENEDDKLMTPEQSRRLIDFLLATSTEADDDTNDENLITPEQMHRVIREIQEDAATSYNTPGSFTWRNDNNVSQVRVIMKGGDGGGGGGGGGSGSDIAAIAPPGARGEAGDGFINGSPGIAGNNSSDGGSGGGGGAGYAGTDTTLVNGSDTRTSEGADGGNGGDGAGNRSSGQETDNGGDGGEYVTAPGPFAGIASNAGAGGEGGGGSLSGFDGENAEGGRIASTLIFVIDGLNSNSEFTISVGVGGNPGDGGGGGEGANQQNSTSGEDGGDGSVGQGGFVIVSEYI